MFLLLRLITGDSFINIRFEMNNHIHLMNVRTTASCSDQCECLGCIRSGIPKLFCQLTPVTQILT